jgi:hypothetical protein
MRNPAIDPAPGDVLGGCPGKRVRAVLEVRMQPWRENRLVVEYAVRYAGRTARRTCTLEAWRKWARDLPPPGTWSEQ